MNLDKAFRAVGPERYPFIKEAVRRLDAIVCDSLDETRGKALAEILQVFRIAFRDGFVINGDTDDENIVGTTEAAVIVASLCNRPDEDWTWWKCPTSIAKWPGFQDTFHQLLGEIVSHSDVQYLGK